MPYSHLTTRTYPHVTHVIVCAACCLSFNIRVQYPCMKCDAIKQVVAYRSNISKHTAQRRTHRAIVEWVVLRIASRTLLRQIYTSRKLNRKSGLFSDLELTQLSRLVLGSYHMCYVSVFLLSEDAIVLPTHSSSSSSSSNKMLNMCASVTRVIKRAVKHIHSLARSTMFRIYIFASGCSDRVVVCGSLFLV